MKKSLLLLSAGAAALAIPAHAQDVAPQGSVADTYDPNAIIVTATRRASPLSSVPIAVSAVTAESMQNSGASDIRQLNQLAPSLLVSSSGTEANGAARIRGIGTVGDNPGLESSVAVFIDGVYRSRTGAGLSDLGEIERIEVLRGPQGTLFGRNTSAGLINIVSKAPEFTFGAKGEITYGNYDYWRLSGRVTGPVSEQLALSLDGVWSKRDGFMDLIDGTGSKVGDANDRDRYFLRGQALWEPNDALSVRIIGDYTNRDESCCAAAYISTDETVPGASPGTTATSPTTNRIAQILNAIAPGSVPVNPSPYDRAAYITAGRDYVSKLEDWGVSAEINYDFGPAKLTSITAYRDYKSKDFGDYDYNAADVIYRDPGTFRQFRTFTQELRLQGTAFEEKLDWLVGGYYADEKLTLRDNIVFGADYGKFATCRLLTANLTPQQSAAFPYAACGSTAGVSGLISALVPAPLQPAFQALLNIPDGTGDTDSRYFQKSENWALFTHNIVHITDTVDFTAGLRYTHESKKFSADLNNNNAICPALQQQLAGAVAGGLGPAAQQAAGGILALACLGNSSTGINALDLNDSISDGEFSGIATLSFKPVKELLLYASYSRGYKAGGYNLDRFELGNTGLSTLSSSPGTYFFPRTNADAASLRFAPEKVDAFEIGLKYGTRKWSANIAAFRQEFDNFQLNTFNGTSFVVQNINGCGGTLTPGSINAGGGRCASDDVEPGLISQGVEIELTASPVRNLRVTGGLTYAEAKFRKTLVGSSDGQTPLDPALFLLPGAINSNAPEIVTTVSFAWTPDIGSSGLSGLVYFDGRMTSDYNTGSDLFPEKTQDGYSVWNARIGLRGPEERWAVEFWGQNIFNTQYTQIGFNTPLQGSGSSAHVAAGRLPVATQLFSAYLAEPRTYGITLRGKF
jgi:outer membrane receptor protein involved in Fe transport